MEDEEADPDAEESSAPAVVPVVPTMFRWVSSTKSDTPAFTFSIPVNLLPEDPGEGSSGKVKTSGASSPTPMSKLVPICDVRGCSQPRKYKLVKDPSKGGCGMEHLKALQVQ